LGPLVEDEDDLGQVSLKLYLLLRRVLIKTNSRHILKTSKEAFVRIFTVSWTKLADSKILILHILEF
jgi:hypothetical protein